MSNNQFSELASELKIHATKVGQIATALQNVGLAPSDEAIRGTFKLMVERNILPKDAAPIYASYQKAEEVRQNPSGKNDSKFGLIQGAEELRRVAHEQTQSISDQIADDVTAAFVGDVFTKVFSGYAYANGEKTKSVLAQITGLSGLRSEGMGEINLTQMALSGGGKGLPFSSGLLLTASSPDPKSEETPEQAPVTVSETAQPVEV